MDVLGKLTFKVVARCVVGRDLAGICRGAVERLEVLAIPVDNEVVGDIVVNRGGTGFVGGDEGAGHVEPAIVGPWMVTTRR